MFYTYVLQSTQDGKLYVGSTKDLRRRVKEHNAGDVPSTKPRRPFTLIYYEAYRAGEDSRKREDQLKLRGRALGQLKRRLPFSLRQDRD